MGFKFSISGQGTNLKKRFGAWEKQERTAWARAANRAMVSARAAVAKDVAGAYTIKSADVKRATKIQKASAAVRRAVMSISGRRIPLIQFKAKDTGKRGVTFKIKKAGGKVGLRHAFIASVRSRQVFERTRAGSGRVGRGPLRMMVGPSIPMLAGARKIRKAVNAVLSASFWKNYRHEMAFRKSRGGGEFQRGKKVI